MTNEEAVNVLRIMASGIELKGYTELCLLSFKEAYEKAIKVLEERPQGELKEYKPLELDYNVKSAVENLKTAYWSNDTEKYAKAFTEAEEIIISAICHHGYIVMKGGAE